MTPAASKYISKQIAAMPVTDEQNKAMAAAMVAYHIRLASIKVGGNTMTQAQFNQLSNGDTVTGTAVVRGIRLICTVSVKESKKGIQKLALHAGCGVCSTIDPKTWEVCKLSSYLSAVLMAIFSEVAISFWSVLSPNTRTIHIAYIARPAF